MKSIIISADEIKKTFKDYNPNKSSDVHRKSAKLADKRFISALKNKNYSEVILMCGGSASGKTEFVSEYLINNSTIIFDGTLSTIEGARIKIKKIKKQKKYTTIILIIPDNIQRAHNAFLNRDRKYDEMYFHSTHAGCRKTALWTLYNYPKINLIIYESTYINNKMRFKKIIFNSKKQQIDYLSKNQYNNITLDT